MTCLVKYLPEPMLSISTWVYRNTLQLKYDHFQLRKCIFCQADAFENVVCKQVALICKIIFAYWLYAGLILSLTLANERCRYKVTPSLIGWVQT